jgi:malonyl-CoA/methylmalonyl-CoA synthetase
VSHPDVGEGVVAVVVPKGPQATDSEKILSALNGRLARFKVPRHVVIVDDLPRNTMGKVQKNVLRDQFKDVFAAVT